MKIRPWLTVYILLALSTVILTTQPLGVTGDNGQSWDTYQTTWTQVNYQNISTIWIYHPVNGSLVSDNQKLEFVVVPFDVDEYLYTVNVRKNNVLMYTCNQEIVYDFSIYTTNPINQIITVTFTLNNKLVLELQYNAILSGPSLNRDFTDQWLQYQAQKENESLTGREVVNIRDEKLNDINLVVMTGLICIAFTTIAGLIVILFKLLSMMNAFTGIMMFITGIFWINGVREIDATMRAIQVVTATDVAVYWSSIAILSLIFAFSLVSYVVGYKIGKSRLTPWKFWGFDIKNRTVNEYETVIHKRKGKYYWWIQNSWDAFKQAILKRMHPLIFEHGDLTDTFQLNRAKNIPENNDNSHEFKAIDKSFNSLHSKMAFYTNPLEDKEIIPGNCLYCNESLPKRRKKYCCDEHGEKYRLELEEKINNAQPKPKKDIDQKLNFEAWKFTQDNTLIKPDIPIIILKGNPEFIDIYNEHDYKNINEKLKDIREKAETGYVEQKIEDVEKAKKDFHIFRKKKPKPYAKGVVINLSNAFNYDMLHFIDKADYLDQLSTKYKDKDRMLHEKTVELEVKSTEKAMEKYLERDKQIKELQDRKNRGDKK